MSVEGSRKPRADSLRNRAALLEAAKASFAADGASASLEAVARRAGVGIGTLYRHFPTRDAMVEAVYRHEVEQLAAAGARLLEAASAAGALREWLRLLVDYVATKKVVAQALESLVGGEVYLASGAEIGRVMEALVARAAASGEVRPDFEPGDLMRAVLGITQGAGAPGWQASALRLVDILMDGLTAPPQAREPLRKAP